MTDNPVGWWMFCVVIKKFKQLETLTGNEGANPGNRRFGGHSP